MLRLSLERSLYSKMADLFAGYKIFFSKKINKTCKLAGYTEAKLKNRFDHNENDSKIMRLA